MKTQTIETDKLDQKQIFQYRIGSLLDKKDPLLSERSFKSKILSQLNNFHQFYHERYQQTKNKLKQAQQKNWQYTSKMIKYENILQNNQILLKDAKNKIEELQKIIEDYQTKQMKVYGEFQEKLNNRDLQIQKLNQTLKSMISTTTQKQYQPSKKIIKLKDKNNNKQNTIQNIPTSRTNQPQNIENQKIIQNLIKQKQQLLYKLKHYETDRQYQQQRIKNATLNLQLELKIKQEHIRRLAKQIEIYEIKFNKIIVKNSQKIMNQKVQIMDYDEQIIHDYYQNLINNSNADYYDQSDKITQKTTQKKVQLPTKKQTHRRHVSSNLQNTHKNSMDQYKNIQVKIYPYDRNRFPKKIQ